MRTEIKVKLTSNQVGQLVNPQFLSGSDGWVAVTSGWQFEYGKVTKLPGNVGNLRQVGIVNGTGLHRIKLTVMNPYNGALAGSFFVGIGNTNSSNITTSGVHYIDLNPTLVSYDYFVIVSDSTFNGSITDISIAKVDGVWTNIDMYDEIDVPITFSIAEVQDISKRNAAYSKSIEVPGTKLNNQLFKHIYNISTSGAWEFNSTVDAVIVQDSNILVEGVMELQNIVNTNDEIKYEILIFQSLSDLYTSMGGKYLTENDYQGDNIDFSEYNELLTWNNIQTKIYDVPQPDKGSGLTYCMIDKTGAYDFPVWNAMCYRVGPDLQELTLAGLSDFNFNYFTPAIFIKEIWDKIFAKYNFTYESDFLNSDTFKALIYPHTDKYLYKPNDEVLDRSASLFKDQSTLWNTVDDYYTPYPPYKFTYAQNSNFDIVAIGNSVSYNPTTGIFTAPFNGIYEVDLDYEWNTFLYSQDVLPGGKLYYIDNGIYLYEKFSTIVKLVHKKGPNWTGPSVEVILDSDATDYTNLIDHWPGTGQYVEMDSNRQFNLSSSNKFTYTKKIYMRAGDQVYVKVETTIPFRELSSSHNYIWQRDFVGSLSLAELSMKHNIINSTLKITNSKEVCEGDTIRVNNILHKIKQSDFISSIIKMFNLYLQPIGNRSFRIEPTPDFYLIDTVPHDITKKIAHDLDIEIKPASDLTKKVIRFQYAEDIDYHNTKYTEDTTDRYGSFIQRGKFNQDGTDNVDWDIVFAPTLCSSFSKNMNNNLYTHNSKIYTYKNDSKVTDSSKKYKPRILYFAGNVPSPYFFNLYSFLSNSSMAFQQTFYPLTLHINNTWNNHTVDFNFGVNDDYPGMYDGANWITKNNLYNTYYGKYIEELTHPDAKIVTMWVNVTTQDIANFKFWKMMFIDGIYYRVNKIFDFVPGKLTKIEFIQVIDQYITFNPSTPVKPPVKPDIDITINKDPVLNIIDGNLISTKKADGPSINSDIIDANGGLPAEGGGKLLHWPTNGLISTSVMDGNASGITPATSFLNLNSSNPPIKTSKPTYDIFAGVQQQNANYFMFEWTVPGTSLSLPFANDLGTLTVNCNVDFGDGTPVVNITAWDDVDATHTYLAGTYTVKIWGDLPFIDFYNSGHQLKLKRIISWGVDSLGVLKQIFSGATNLYSIPQNSINTNTLTQLWGMFYNNSSLTSIPANLFDNCTAVHNFTNLFNGSGLTSIPAGLFDNSSSAKNFSTAFANCANLNVEIPANLFANCLSSASFNGTFINSPVTLIPNGLFDNLIAVDDYSSTFANTDITSIPSGLFDSAEYATLFESTFSGTSITEIPTGLFDYAINAESFNYTFKDCTSLTSIPATLFDNTTAVTQFIQCFKNCTSLTGAAPELWTMYPTAAGTQCFNGCTGLSNYASIPAGWK